MDKMRVAMIDVPPPGHPLQKLGEYLSLMLDEDEWAAAEEYLLAAWAQRVPEVAITGEPIAILRREIGEDTWFDWTPVLPNSKTHKQLKAAGEMDYCEVYQRHTHSITATELASLREKAAEADELRKDAERLEWLITASSSGVRIKKHAAHYTVWDTREGLKTLANGASAREAIDAAIAQGKGE